MSVQNYGAKSSILRDGGDDQIFDQGLDRPSSPSVKMASDIKRLI